MNPTPSATPDDRPTGYRYDLEYNEPATLRIRTLETELAEAKSKLLAQERDALHRNLDRALNSLADKTAYLDTANAELARLRAERDQWEATARRLASESGWENSDFLQPDAI